MLLREIQSQATRWLGIGDGSPVLPRWARGAYSFTAASSQHVSAGSSPISTYPLTVAAWFYPNSTSNLAIASINKNGANGPRVCLQCSATGKLTFLCGDGSATSQADSTASYSTGQWQHAVGITSGATSRFVYLDGTKSAANTTSRVLSGMDRLGIGQRSGAAGAGLFFDGLLAEVGFWNVVLDEAEIAALKSGLSPLRIRPQSLKSYHPLVRENVAPIGPAFTAYNSPTVAAHPRIFY